MQATVIPINEDLLDIITVLNNGVKPEIEDQRTYFIYLGDDEVPEILTAEDMENRYSQERGNLHMHAIGYFFSKDH